MVVLVAMIVETLCIGDSKCEADVVNEEQVDIARLDQKYSKRPVSTFSRVRLRIEWYSD